MTKKAEVSGSAPVAVLTGDVVGSSELPLDVREGLPGFLREVAKVVGERFPGAFPYDLDIFRGDSWQWLMTDALHAIRAAVLFRCQFRGLDRSLELDTRVAIGIGGVDFLSKERLSESDGEAFRLSGEALEAATRGRCLVARSALWKPSEAPLWRSVVGYLDYHVSELTERQAWVLAGRLRGWTQQQIADASDPVVDQAVIGRTLGRIREHLLLEVLDELEARPDSEG